MKITRCGSSVDRQVLSVAAKRITELVAEKGLVVSTLFFSRTSP